MRWDEIRSGLLAGPMVPNSVTDLRPLSSPTMATPHVDEALTDRPMAGILAGPGATDFLAQTMTRGAMSPPKSNIEIGQSPKMRETLGELSGLAQGRGFGRMISEKDNRRGIEDFDPTFLPTDPEDDLPNLPQRQPPDIEGPLDDIITRGAAGPLRNLKTTDPNMRDLFKDWF